MIRAGPIPPEQKGPPMSLLYAATVKTKKGTARLDRGGALCLPGVRKPIKPGDVVAVDVEDGKAVSSRVTATRVALIGVLALAAKKKTGGEKYLVVETKSDVHVLEVERKHTGDAVAFAAKARKSVAS